MIMKNWLAVILLSFLTVACDLPEEEDFEAEENEYAWLEGKWEARTQGGVMKEEWEMVNDTQLVGKGEFNHMGRTIFTETLRLIKDGDDTKYIVNIPTQNRGEDVIYVLDRSNKEELAFENIEHDFPRRISYKQQGDTLVVELSGVRNGNPQAEILKFTKVKEEANI